MSLLLLVATTGFGEVLPAPLETPPFEYTLNESVRALPGLVLLGSSPNEVTDFTEWFDRIWVWPAITYHNGGVNDATRGTTPPRGIDRVLRTPGAGRFYLYQVIFGDEAAIAFYGSPPNRFGVVLDPRILVIHDPATMGIVRVFDFINYAHCPGDDPADTAFTFQQLVWAEVLDNVLYVSNAHPAYAGSSGGENAYVTAISLDPLGLLWRSQPLVPNSGNFLILGDAIITGYGFADEDDYIYELDRLTGEVVDRIGVPSAPEYLFARHDTLFVRCYDTDLVYGIRW